MVGVKLNGQSIDLDENTNVRITLQVSDIADISTVNASYSNQFTAPITPNNIEQLDYLGLVADGSRKPYELIGAEVDVNGVTILTNGILNINKTTDSYSLNIQEGIVSFFKVLEGLEFGDGVDISELNHVKDLDTVADSFENPYYKYLIGDYGGQTSYRDTPLGVAKINIDFLVPSAKVSYLFDKLVETAGYTWSGFFKENPDYTEAYITYPKPNSEEVIENALRYKEQDYAGSFVKVGDVFRFRYNSQFNSWVILDDTYNTELVGLFPSNHNFANVRINQTGAYSISYNFVFDALYRLKTKRIWYLPHEDPYGETSLVLPTTLVVRRNGVVIKRIRSEEETTITQIFNEGDEISIAVETLTLDEVRALMGAGSPNATSTVVEVLGVPLYMFSVLEATYNELSFENTSFAEAFQDFKPTDLAKEIMIRFGAVPFVDNANRHIEFKSIDSLIDYEKTGFQDWTEVIAERKSESYTIGKYGQRNFYRHKYNLEGDDYADGFFDIDNKNLEARVNVWESKIYAPSQTLSSVRIISQILRVRPTPLWEVEVKDNNGEPEISYKGLSNRFYWVKSKWDNRTVILGSKFLGEERFMVGFPTVDTGQTTYDYFIPKYNQGNMTLLNDVRVHEFTATLDIVKLVNIDFSKPIYIGQEASYYKLNRVIFEGDKEATIEAIKIKR